MAEALAGQDVRGPWLTIHTGLDLGLGTSSVGQGWYGVAVSTDAVERRVFQLAAADNRHTHVER